LSFLAHDIRAMVIKDIRTLLRDPMQWSQILIFFGLLGLYFASLRSFHYDRLPEMWRSLIAFLNVFSVSTVICALASRFIYPQLSLEGQGFWILGLSPTTMKRILLTKFGLAVVGTSSVSMLLMYVSTAMLRVDPVIRWIAILLALAVSFASSGMSTGLGAIFLDLKQRNPAAIVSGFGGTLNLVLGLGFMIVTVLPFAAMFHLAQQGHLGARWFGVSIAAAVAWTVALTVLAVVVPLWLGRRALHETEY
jgi:ABC-2 type transport system permease protein